MSCWVTSAHAEIRYVYDAAGRLIQVIADDGASARYVYDAVGNITAIQRLAAGELSFTAFSPTTGAAGAQVTLHGSGFANVPGANAVSFNGAAASVVSANSNQLTVQVPVGASSGPISITVAGNLVASTSDFVFAAAPSVSGFTPSVVNAGDSVTVTGENLYPEPVVTQVSLGGALGYISAANSDEITFGLPVGARSNPITVRTIHGQALSSRDLIIAPSALGATNIVSTGQLAEGGAVASVTVTPGKFGVFTFRGTAGQYLSIQLSSLVTTPSASSVSYQVFGPGNVVITSGSVSSTVMSIHIPKIVADGTYLLAFSAAAVSLEVAAALDVNPVLDGGGPLVPAATTAARQSKRFVMPATAGAHMGVGITNFTLTPATGNSALAIVKPSGVTADSVTCSSGSTCARSLVALSETGDYLITVTPSAATTMSFSLAVTHAVTGTLVPGVPLSVNLDTVGRFAMLDFTVGAGQNAAVSLSSLVTSPLNRSVYLGIYQPNGAQLAGGFSAVPVARNFMDLPAGTYKVQLSPQIGETATLQLKLGITTTSTLPIDASTTSVATTVPGQVAYFKFAGVAGQHVGVGLSNLGLTPSSGGATLAIVGVDTTSCSAGGSCARSLVNLPQTRDYIVSVTPTTMTTMSFSLAVSPALSSVLTAGTPLNVNLTPVGRFAMLEFTVSAGHNGSVSISALTTSPAGRGVWFGIYNPSGVQIQGFQTSGAATHTLTNLPAGTYRVQLSPVSGVLATMMVTFQ